MDLNIVWFLLIAILYMGFFILDGFDFGVGMLLPFISQDKDPKMKDRKRRILINTIGPHWDGNEVWLITAGGATFAAFPEWYATLFSGFYLALFLLLIALIGRGVSFEFRSKEKAHQWRNTWDWVIFGSSVLSPFLLGVAFGNIVRGVPIDSNMNYVGNFFNLLNPYSLMIGLTFLVTFMLHGTIFLSLKTSGDIKEKTHKISNRLWVFAVALVAFFLIWTYVETNILNRLGVGIALIPLIGLIAILLTGWFLRRSSDGWAFFTTALSIAVLVITLFMALFPRVMVSSLDPAYSLTIYNASSSPYTLRVMTIIAITFVPVVLAYQIWSYWIFRKRLTVESHLEY
jgi:cytochrome bd ubiquinol oxidase subunit II